MAVTSKQHEIITAVVTRLATINGTGDYNTDFGGHVEDSRTDWTAGDPDPKTGQASELPAISVFELPTETQDAPNARRKVIHVMSVLIKIFLPRQTAPQNARLAIADVMRAILGTGTRETAWLAERWPDADSSPTVQP